MLAVFAAGLALDHHAATSSTSVGSSSPLPLLLTRARTLAICEGGHRPPVEAVQVRVVDQAPRLRTRHGAMSAHIRCQEFCAPPCRSDSAQIFRGGLACLSISNNVERDLLSLVETRHPCAFDCADMYEDILAAIIWLIDRYR